MITHTVVACNETNKTGSGHTNTRNICILCMFVYLVVQMFECLLLNLIKLAKLIWMKFGIEIASTRPRKNLRFLSDSG